MGAGYAEAPVLEHRGQVDQEINPSMSKSTSSTSDGGGISADEAQRLTQRIKLTAVSIRYNMRRLWDLVEEAKTANVHQVLGYPSWTAYLADTLGEEPLRLSRDERQEIVAMLSGEGLSTRAIAPIVGVTQMTVQRDLAGVTNVSPASAPTEPSWDVPAWASGPESTPTAVDTATSGTHVVTGLDGKSYTFTPIEKDVPTVRSLPQPPRANEPTEYLRHLASIHPTMRIAFEADGHAKYASLTSLDSAARRAGVEWRFTEKQWQARAASSADVLNRSTLAIEVALSAIAERVHMETITPDQANEALERLASTTAIRRIIKSLQEISNV